MKILIKKSYLAVAAVTALVVSACGVGGDNNVAGIGGSGYISNGSISSFGSVFVNGVEFETNASTFEIEDDNSLTQDDLRIGMVVEVTGSINSDGITGTATHIKYGDNLEGPVSDLVPGVNLTTTFKVLGNTVVVSEVSTTFENMTFADIADGNVLEVSGFYDQDDVLHASYIELKSTSASADSVFEIKGTITNLNIDDFMIQGVAINAATAVFEDLPNGLQNGLSVEVKGKLVNGIIVASKIESEDSFSEDTEVEIEGIITRYVDNSDFDVNNQRVDASRAELLPAGLILNIGAKVEIKGQVSNSVLIASQVEAREGSAGVSAKVFEIFAETNRFTVEILSGQLVSVQLTTATRLKDDLGPDDNLLISGSSQQSESILKAGDFVSVQGFESASDTITATEVKRESEVKEAELQGIVTAESENDFTVLGVVYPVDINTMFDGIADIVAFQQLTELGVTVISINDSIVADGIANEVEIED